MTNADLLRRVREYAERERLTLGPPLGSGVHGNVFSAEHQISGGGSAVKVHHRETPYRRERDVYVRLCEREVTSIRGCHVPELIAFDDELWVIEMTVVTRPFALDFGGAYLDARPEFSDEVLEDWQADKREQFGPRWPEVQSILRALEAHGIHLVDVNPGNLAFVE